MDFASKSGFVHVLEWWRCSGLPLRYTDAALEQASSQGHIAVLDWWRGASHYDDSSSSQGEGLFASTTSDKAISIPDTERIPPLRLKVGKALIYAAQNGQTAAIRWWMSSGIPTVHEDAVARTASAHGHVNVLQLWMELKGEKMQYDHQVLVGPTKNQHVDVLEWWKMSGYRVEYKTCDIEEALEDSRGGAGEDDIRRWWAKNGLNLGVGTTVALSPAQYQLGIMSTRRAPLGSNPNAVNSPFRKPGAPVLKRARQQLDQEDVGYDEQPPIKRAAFGNGRLPPRTPPQKQSLQQAEARVFGKRPGNVQPTAFERRLLEAKNNKAQEVQEKAQRVDRTGRTTTETFEGIRQWQKHYRKVFPTFVFYFESVPDETRIRHTKTIRAFGATEVKFFSKEVTHVITSRSVPDEPLPSPTIVDAAVAPNLHAYLSNARQTRTINPALLDRTPETQPQDSLAQSKPKFNFDKVLGQRAPSAGIRDVEPKKAAGTVDILQRAKAMNMKIWTLDKLERIAKTMLDNRADEPSLRGLGGRGTALNATLPTKARQESGLSTLLRKEQINGPSDAINETSGTIPFRGPHIYVRCMDEKTKPILVKEFPRVANKEDGEWPQFRGNSVGKCPFIVDHSLMRKDMERARAEMEDARAQAVLERRQTLRARSMAAPVSTVPRQANLVTVRKQPLAESRESGNTLPPTRIFGMGQENTEVSEHQEARRQSPVKAPGIAPSAARLRFFNGEPAASGMQASNITSAIRSQMISSTAAQPGAKAGTSKEIHGLQRKVLEKNSAPVLQATRAPQRGIDPLGAARAERHIPLARQTRKQTQERMVHIDEESTVSEEEEDVWRTEEVQGRQVVRVEAAKKDPKPGYCENCRDKYDDFDAHILDRKHRKFALTSDNWKDLDKLLAQLGRPIKEAFSDSF
ncbi:MAG: hypothetical protein Q9169_007645 [Polycauliona sp. 2 TL-2023]